MHTRRLGVALLAFGSCALAHAGAPGPGPGAQQFSLRNDFSTTQNPHGAWAYLESGAPITCMLHQPNYIPELTGWCCRLDWGAAVAKFTDEPAPGWQDAILGDIVIHVSPSPSAPIAVRWTAPADGVISISGAAWAAFFDPSRDAGWTLSLNQTVLAQRASIVGMLRTDLGATFTANIVGGKSLADHAVAAGDTLTFSTYNLSTFGHFMGVEIEIDFTPDCPGDTNGDGLVNFVDLNRVLSAFGASTGDPGFIAGADLNGDGAVSFLDLNIVLSFFGQTC